MRFTKMHGLGNDFIVIEGKELDSLNLEELALRMCDRHRGIGADGLLLFYPSETCALTMRLFNSDGSEADMCGNGLRCLVKYAFDRKLVSGRSFTVETKAGVMQAEVSPSSAHAEQIEINMGPPRLKRKEIPVQGDGEATFIEEMIEAGERSYRATCLFAGNPHCVVFRDSLEDLALKDEGYALENHSLFPVRTNVEFVKVESPELLHVKVWERGAGETLACGTGACASLVAAHLTGRTGRDATVVLPGGSLRVHWNESGDVYLKGPAQEVFTGEIKAISGQLSTEENTKENVLIHAENS